MISSSASNIDPIFKGDRDYSEDNESFNSKLWWIACVTTMVVMGFRMHRMSKNIDEFINIEEDLRAQAVGLKSKLSEKTAEIESLTQQVQDLKTEMEPLQAKVTTLTNKVDQKREAIAEKDAQITKLTESVAAAEKETKAAKSASKNSSSAGSVSIDLSLDEPKELTVAEKTDGDSLNLPSSNIYQVLDTQGKRCAYFGKERDLLRCNRCRAVFCCNATCQSKHWKVHQVECKKCAHAKRAKR